MNEKLDHVQKLVFRAGNDLKTAKDEGQTDKPATDAVCFHCQQATEKLLKAWIHWHDVSYAHTHDLSVLLEVCQKIDSGFTELEPVDVLTPYGVEVRYADDFYLPPIDEMRQAIELAEATERFVHARFVALGINPIKDFSEGASP